MSDTETTALVPDNGGKVRTISVSESAWLDTATFDQAYRVAKAMARMSLCPDHLKGRDIDETAANCFLVVMQAQAWDMSPFALMNGTYNCYGRLGYEGKVVGGVINTRAGLTGRLRYDYDGKGTERRVTVWGTFKGEDEPRTLSGTVKQWAKPQYSKKQKKTLPPNPMWFEEGPGQDQKLAYVGAMWWARRYCPEVILGVRIAEEEGYGDESTASVTSRRSLMPDHPTATIEPEVAAIVSPSKSRTVEDLQREYEDPLTPEAEAELAKQFKEDKPTGQQEITG